MRTDILVMLLKASFAEYSDNPEAVSLSELQEGKNEYLQKVDTQSGQNRP